MTTQSTTGSTYVATVDTVTNLITIEQTVQGTSDVFNLLF